ncbi:MAG: hypothetical protein J6Y78_01715 [Paludibacteraceae bacterium]|nr:hypothetical protein [Paludibacteraceae bacterium]
MTVKEALQELAKEIRDEIMRRVWEEGVNPKTGTNTLIYSDLIKDMEVKPISDNTIVFQIADYYMFVVKGWRRTGNWGGGIDPFIENIIVWMRKKNVHSDKLTDNELAWRIVKNIFKGGIMARPFINYDPNGDPSVVLAFLDEFFSRWADKVFQLIMEEVDRYFNE